MADETLLTNVSPAVLDYMEGQSIEKSMNQQVFRPVLTAAYPGHAMDFTGKGDNKLIVQRDVVTFAALAEGVDNANVVYAPTARTLTPEMVGASFRLSWEAFTQPEISPYQMIIDEVANAWATKVDSGATLSYAAKYTEANASSPTHEIGTNAVAFDAALVRAGVQLLMTAKARRPYNLFIDPIQWGELLQDALALSLLKESGAQPAGFMAVEGVRMDQFVGKLFGCNIWCVPGGMIESSGLHAMMLGASALGIAYKKMSTPLSGTSSELNIDVAWNSKVRAYDVDISIFYAVSGISGASATTNMFMVDIKS